MRISLRFILLSVNEPGVEIESEGRSPAVKWAPRGAAGWESVRDYDVIHRAR